MIRVVFFAQLREQLGVATTDVPAANIRSIVELKQYLFSQNPSWESVLSSTKVLSAINHAYSKGDTVLNDGDEVAFFPPVTGG